MKKLPWNRILIVAVVIGFGALAFSQSQNRADPLRDIIPASYPVFDWRAVPTRDHRMGDLQLTGREWAADIDLNTYEARLAAGEEKRPFGQYYSEELPKLGWLNSVVIGEQDGEDIEIEPTKVSTTESNMTGFMRRDGEVIRTILLETRLNGTEAAPTATAWVFVSDPIEIGEILKLIEG